MPNTGSIRAKQRFSGKPAWLPGSNQQGRVGVPAGPIAGVASRPATNRGIAQGNYNTIYGGTIARRTNTIVTENGEKKDTKNLVVVQNQLSRGGGPQPSSGMFGVTAGGVNSVRYYFRR